MYKFKETVFALAKRKTRNCR